MKYKIVFLITTLFFMQQPSQLMALEGPADLTKKKNPSYKFVEYLSEAEAVLLYEAKDGVIGNWTGTSFNFPGIKIDSPVKEASIIIDEVSHKGIRVVPAPKAITQLKFKGVPPGSKLLLYYGGSKDASVSGPGYFYLQVWVGNHRIKKTRISVEDGWKKDVIDLGVVPFLTSDITISYLISSDEPTGVRFTIIPELKI